MAIDTETNWKADLQKLKGRTITGYATTAMDGQMTSLMLTFDDESWVDLGVAPIGAVWDGVYIDVRPGHAEGRSE